ncbi:Phosphate-binding protein PstS 1 [Rhizoclosmatium hyalinum]|nr:Phosphate-binding protein PstS 1 [Rhizoclosmatium hyalinum]
MGSGEPHVSSVAGSKQSKPGGTLTRDQSKPPKPPVLLQFRIVMLTVLPLSAIALICVLLSSRVHESVPNISHDSIPHLLINASGSSLITHYYQAGFSRFEEYLHQQQSSYIPDLDIRPGSNTLGQSEFFAGYNLFAATDVDVSADDGKYFLPDDDSLPLNATKYIDPRVPAHYGNILIPFVGQAVGIAFNIPGFPKDKQLVLNGPVLGDIFCQVITKWNDPAIKALNPNVDLPNETIRVIGRGDVTPTNLILSLYLGKYSATFKKLVGASASPKWPKGTTLAYTAIEMVYTLSTLRYAIAYIAIETVKQAVTLGLPASIAFVINANQTLSTPQPTNVIAAIEGMTSNLPFTRHNFMLPFDINVPSAYPITVVSHTLLRENYYYFSPGNQSECDRVKAMVYFFQFFFTDTKVSQDITNIGAVPIAGIALSKNLQALNLITCNRRNVMEELMGDLEKVAFYTNRTSEYEWETSVTFWNNHDKFAASPISSFLYILFYASLILCNAIPFASNMKRYLSEHSSSHSDDGEVQTGENIKRSSVPHEELDEDELEDLKEQEELQAARKAGKIPFTLQNVLGIVTQFFTCFQVLYLCLTRSTVIQKNIYLDIISYIGLIFDWFPYYLLLNFSVLIWIVCMFYTIYGHGIMETYYPQKLMSLTKFHAFLAEFLPNFAVIFYNPSVEMLSKVFDCRLSTHHGEYHSELVGTCWEGAHWSMAIVAIVLVCTFTNFVVKFSKILKQFDLIDEEWCIYVDSVAKTFMVILYFNIPNVYFLGLTFVLLVGLSLCSLIGKPNTIFWYNYFRGGIYLYSAAVYFILFVLEIIVKEDDYEKRTAIYQPLSLAILVSAIALCATLYLIIRAKYKAGLTKAEQQKKEEELKKFFAAFDGDDSEILKSAAESGAGSVQGGNVARQFGSVTSQQSVSPAFWNKIETVIDKAKKANMLTKDEAKAIKLAIKAQDPVITLVFSRCGRDVNKLVDHLKRKVFQVLAKTKDGAGMRPSAFSKATSEYGGGSQVFIAHHPKND